jgi:nucleotide-binding universal stress UspA family protein
MKKILVPLDGSVASIKAVETGIKIAREYKSDITFVTVVLQANLSKFYSYGIFMDKELEEARIKVDEVENKMIDDVLSKFDLSSVKYEKKVLSGEAYEEILDLAKKEDYDLIVIGKRGFSKFMRFFVGSVTQRVLADAPCPVLVVQE